MPDRDRYGGDPDVAFDATGYFRLEKDDRWWLVTPEGYGYLGFGLNHVTLNLMQRTENRSYWLGRFGLPSDVDDADWLPPFREKVAGDLETFGFNHLGCHSPIDYYKHAFVPYIQTIRFVDICHWQTPTTADFRDVFSRDFERHCRALAKEVAAPREHDPYLIGYSFTDCPIFTEEEAAARGVRIYGAPREATPTWPRVLRNQGGEAAGKRAYVDAMRELYGNDIRAFNAAYETRFDTFDALAQAEDWRPEVDPANAKEREDNAHFLQLVVDRYYTVAVEAIRRYDRHHLILGDKLNGNTNMPDDAVALAGEHMDLIFYQWYATYEDQKERLDLWSTITGKPLFNGDASFSTPNVSMPNPLGPQYATQEQRAAAFTDFAESAFSRPDFVGWSWCGWMDSWATVPRQMARQHSGLQDPFGNLHEPMVEAMTGFSRRIYDVARGKGSGDA
jgi:hypothetical protein